MNSKKIYMFISGNVLALLLINQINTNQIINLLKMISIEKIMQQLSQCKDTTITLPPANNNAEYVQNTAIDIRKSELQMLNNNFQELSNINYTMETELEKPAITTITSNNSAFVNTNTNTNTNTNPNPRQNQEVIPNKSLIVYMENETANLPEIILTLFKNREAPEWYVYGVKNPDSFYKSFLLLNKIDFIVKNRTETRNEVATFKREMAMQFENFYRTLNYRKLRINKNNMIHNLTYVDNYAEWDLFQYIADYNKVNFIVLDIVNEKYLDIAYNDNNIVNKSVSDTVEKQYVIIVKYAANTYLPLMKSDGKHTFDKSILEMVGKYFERMVIKKFSDPLDVDEEEAEAEEEEQEPEKQEKQPVFSIEDEIKNTNIENDNTNNFIDLTTIGMPIEDMIEINETIDERIINISKPDEPIINVEKLPIDDPITIFDKIPMKSQLPEKKKKKGVEKVDITPSKTNTVVPIEELLVHVATNTTENAPPAKKELKPIAKYTVAELQTLAKEMNIEIQKEGTKGKMVNKLKAELYEEIKEKF